MDISSTGDLPPPTSKSRQNFRGSLTAEQIKSLVADPELSVLQTAEPVDSQVWDMLNELFLPYRPDVQLRVYGFYSFQCDLSFLKQLSNLSNFSADCLMTAKGVENIGRLSKLKNLAVGIFSLESFDFLEALPTEFLQSLSLCATRSKRPDLSVIQRFSNLRTLYIEGQQKNIEVIADLKLLEDITLRSVSPKELTFLSRLNNLWSLDIKLGGVTNLAALEGMTQLKYLELWQIKGLENIEVISSLVGLQNIYLQSLRNVTNLPDLTQLSKLRRIYLENMKGLKNLSALTTASSLQEFVHAMSNNEMSEYVALLSIPSLEKASVYFGSKKKNDEFRDLAAKRNIEEYKFHEFKYS